MKVVFVTIAIVISVICYVKLVNASFVSQELIFKVLTK